VDDLLRRLQKLAERFPQESSPLGEGGKDGFAELEEQFVRRYNNAQQLLKAKDAMSATDTIRQRRNVQNEVQAMAETIKKMTDLVNKERTRKARGRKPKITDEELARLEANMSTFANMLTALQEEVRKSQGVGGALLKEAALPLTASATHERAVQRAGVGLETSGAPPLSAEHQQALQEIYRQEDEQDELLEQIAAIIQEAGQIAETINATVTMQRGVLDGIKNEMKKTEDKAVDTNAKAKKALSEKGCSWERMCCLGLVAILILGMVGVVVNTLA
jgi:t-SNARE complex subunit (syntaxin)